MDEVFESYQKGNIPYMPANWQHLQGVRFIGHLNGVAFFNITNLIVDEEEIPNGTYYASIKDLIFDRSMEEASKRIKKRSRQ